MIFTSKYLCLIIFKKCTIYFLNSKSKFYFTKKYRYRKIIFIHMKTFQLFLIFAIIGSCFPDDNDDDECKIKFNTIIEERCNAVIPGICHINYKSLTKARKCKGIKDCSEQSYCSFYSSPSFHTKKCEEVDSKCTEVTKGCHWYEKDDGDICSDIIPLDGEGDRCDFNRGGACSPFFNECTGLSEDKCASNIPKDFKYKCIWKDSSCQKELRGCSDTNDFYPEYLDKDLCHQLKPSSTDKKCFLLEDGTCQEKYENCAEYDSDQDSCNDDKVPFVQLEEGISLYDLDHRKECFYNTTSKKCLPRIKKCHDLKSTEGEDVCITLEATDSTKKKCVYDSSDSLRCKEQYRTCQLYNDNEEIKTRDECEKIIPDDETKLCYFNEEENKCEERDIFTNCEDYKGDDKNICESITSKTTNTKCVLEKDSTCKERSLHCADTDDEFQCLFYAKANDDNKICAYDSTKSTNEKCFELYKNCEDYMENHDSSSSICTGLQLYNGKYCVFENNKCRSRNKECKDAINEYECKLIEKTGVSDPDKKVCYYDSTETTNKCKETYKYCSDYRGSDADYCQKIKPYDNSGNYLDITSKCIYDTYIGCKRVPKECTDASTKQECNIISPYIEENKTKHCVYTFISLNNYKCQEHYKNCSEVFEKDICKNNIPEGFSQKKCWPYTVKGRFVCGESNDAECRDFDIDLFENLCNDINPNCTYSSSSFTCSKTEKSCAEVNFFSLKDENEDICKSYEVDDPNKICSLKKDKTGCEVIYKELSRNSSDNQEENTNTSSSGFITKGIHLIIILIYLLI